MIKATYKKIRMFMVARLRFGIKYQEGFYLGRNCLIKRNTVITGKKVYIGNKAHLSVGKIFIDDYTLIASNVSMVGGDHRFDQVGVPIRETGRAERKGIIIHKDVWIGHGAIIIDGVEIGEGAIVAAGAIVTRSLPPYGIYAGIPAKKMRERFNSEEEAIIHSKSIRGIYSEK